MSRLLIGYNQLLCAEALMDGQWSLGLFEDLNRLIESIVLYDHVVLLGDYEPAATGVFEVLSRENILVPLKRDAVASLLSNPATCRQYEKHLNSAFGVNASDNAGLSIDVVFESRISPSTADRHAYGRMVDVVSTTTRRGDDDVAPLRTWFTNLIRDNSTDCRASIAYFARGLVHTAIAETDGMDYAPDYLRLPVAALAFSASPKPVSKALYDALSQRLESEVEALAALGMPVALFLPPLTTAVLQKGAKGHNIINEALELRRRFASFRDSYREFEDTLKDPNVSLRDKIAAKNRLFASIVGVIKDDPGRHGLNIKTVWDKVVSSSLDEKGPATKLSLSGLISILLDELLKERTRGKARALFDLWTDALNVKNYGQLLESAFGVTISLEEYKSVKAYSEAVRVIARKRITYG
jgi:hypothetical protein